MSGNVDPLETLRDALTLLRQTTAGAEIAQRMLTRWLTHTHEEQRREEIGELLDRGQLLIMGGLVVTQQLQDLIARIERERAAGQEP